MATDGRVTNVTEHIAGSELLASVSAAASSIEVEDVEEFDLDGGQLTIGAETHTYTADEDTGILTLVGSTLASGYDEGEPVHLVAADGTTTVERFAYVMEPDGEEELEARVPHQFYSLLPVGSRTDDGTAEIVEAEYSGTDLIVTDVLGKRVTGIELEATDDPAVDPRAAGERQIRWVRPSDGAVAAAMRGYSSAVREALEMAVFERGTEGAQVNLYAIPKEGGVSGALIIQVWDGAGASEQYAQVQVPDDAGGFVSKYLVKGDGTSDFLLDNAWSSWTPTLTGWSANPTDSVYRYKQVGKMVVLTIVQGTAGTSNATTKTISLPVTAATVTNMAWEETARIMDNGTIGTAPGFARIASAGTTMAFGKDSSAVGGFTASGSCRIIACTITYESA